MWIRDKILNRVGSMIMKKLMIFFGILGFIGLSAAGDGRDPRDTQDSHGREFISHSVLSEADRARLGEGFDAFLEGSGHVQTALPDGPMNLPGGGMNEAARVRLTEQAPAPGSPEARALFDFMRGSDDEENERPATPVRQVGRRGRDCPGSAQSICTPEPPMVQQTADQRAERERRFAQRGEELRRRILAQRGASDIGTRRTREQAGGQFPQPPLSRRPRRDSDAGTDSEDDSETLYP